MDKQSYYISWEKYVENKYYKCYKPLSYLLKSILVIVVCGNHEGVKERASNYII